MNVQLKLGDFEFYRFEVPEKIPFGGEQRLNVHELVGGARVLDAMGATPLPLEWSGFFVGSKALERARYLDGLRKDGKPLDLTWSGFFFQVVIKSLTCDFQKPYRIPYRITCEVAEDKTDPVRSVTALSLDDSIMRDAAEAARLAQLADAQTRILLGMEANAPLPENLALAPYLEALDKAIVAVSSFATASQAVINRVLEPIAAVRARVDILVRAINGTVRNVTTFGGVLPNNPIARQANKLLEQMNAVVQLPTLLNLDSALGRMQSNIGLFNKGIKQVPVAGGNLYAVATKQYGNAMAWTSIAAANGIKDPQITGLKILSMPSRADASVAAKMNSSGADQITANSGGTPQSGGVLSELLG